MPRKRLYRRLDATRAVRCVWLASPGGYGKTALVTGWIEARSLSCLWYQCDASDGDVATFFHFLGIAARAGRGKAGATLPHFTPEYALGLEAFARRFFEGLFGRFKGPFVWVLDNYHEIGATSSVHRLLAVALELMPDQGRLVVLSRDTPPPALARWRADAAFRLVEVDELVLDGGEARQLAARVPDRGDLRVEELNDMARGWVAGLLLLLRDGGGTLPRRRGRSGGAVFDYLATEVFERLEPGMREFLLRTAWLATVTPGLARTLTRRREAADWLADLERRRLFVDRRSGEPPAYEYHPLFRQFLQHHALAAMGRERVSALLGDTAAALEAQGSTDEAIESYLEASRWSDAVRLMLGRARGLMADGRLAILELWIGRLPPDVETSVPWLGFWRGTCKVLSNPPQGRAILERAHAAFARAGDRAGCLMTWAGISESYFFEMGSFAGFAPWVDELDRLMPDLAAFPSQEVEVCVIGGALGMLMHRPDHPSVAIWARRAMELIPQLPDADLRVQLASFASCAWLWRGDFARSVRAWDACTTRTADARSSPLHRLMLEMNVGSLEWQLGDHVASRLGIEGALKLAGDTGIHVLDGWFHIQSVYAALSEGDVTRAERHLQVLRTQTPPYRLLERTHIRFLQAGALLTRGRVAEALDIAEPELEVAERLGAPFGLDTFRVQTAQAMMLAGRHEEARTLLDLAHGHACAMDSDITRFHARVNLAWSLLDSGDRAGALEAMREGLSIGARHNYMNCHPWWLPAVMARVLVEALRSGIECDYARRLIRRRALAAPEEAAEHWPWAVRIHALGVFRVEADDAGIAFEGKGQARPMELLKALVGFGGKGVRAEVLIEALWPEAEGDAGQRAWDVTLHRLRKLLGRNDLLLLGDGRLSLNHAFVWTDVRAFERFTLRLPRSADGELARALAAELLAHYPGEFMAQEPERPWMRAPRDRLRRGFQRELLRLIGELQAVDRWEDALEACQGGIERDPLAEAFYQQAMCCLGNLGRTAEVARLYRRLRAEIAGAFGIEPSPHSRSIATELGALG